MGREFGPLSPPGLAEVLTTVEMTPAGGTSRMALLFFLNADCRTPAYRSRFQFTRSPRVVVELDTGAL